MTIYPVSSLKQAQAAMVEVEEHGRVVSEFNRFSGQRGTGVDEVTDVVATLRSDLNYLIAGRAISPRFDADAREVVHRALSSLPEVVLSDADFWRYLSSVAFADVVVLRHPKSRKSTISSGVDGNWANYGAQRSSVTESLLYRLFVTAELAYDESNQKDPYHLARVHDVDLWQSHVMRVLSGDNGKYVRALVSWYAGRKDWYAERPGLRIKARFEEFDDEPEKRHLRDLVKRVRRLRSNVIHELLSDAEVVAMINEQAELSIQDIASWGAKKEHAKGRGRSSKSPRKAASAQKKSRAH